MSFARRFKIYLAERFPVSSTVLLVLAFTLSAYTIAPALRQSLEPIVLDWAALAGFLTVLLVFFHLRVFDEFKDFETDMQFHPSRPVPRGLVTLRELRVLGAMTILIEVALNFWLGWEIFLFYLAVLLYSLLMFKEFFIGKWLRHDLVLYTLTHTPIMLLMGLYAYSLYAFRHELPVHASLGFYLGICFLTGLVFEMARKIRSPEDERDGVETYSRYFGTKRVGWVLTSLLLLNALCAWVLGSIIGFVQLYFWCIAFIVGLTSVVILSFHRKATPRQAKNVALYTSLYTLCVYVAIIVASMWGRSIVFIF